MVQTWTKQRKKNPRNHRTIDLTVRPLIRFMESVARRLALSENQPNKYLFRETARHFRTTNTPILRFRIVYTWLGPVQTHQRRPNERTYVPFPILELFRRLWRQADMSSVGTFDCSRCIPITEHRNRKLSIGILPKSNTNLMYIDIPVCCCTSKRTPGLNNRQRGCAPLNVEQVNERKKYMNKIL